MKLSLNSKVRQSDKVISHDFGGTVYILDPRKNTIRMLNNCAGVIWEYTKKRRTVDSVITEVMRVFEVSGPKARRDTISYLAKLIGLGYINSDSPTSKPAGGYTGR